MYIIHLINIYLSVIFIQTATCDVRFVCPAPVAPSGEKTRTDTRHAACISNGRHFNQNYMELTPGLHTIRFESTSIHLDSPFVLSLHRYHENGGESGCVLRDHIPHNNHATITEDCQIDGASVGRCSESTYYVSVNIPDVLCNRCFLRVTQILVDSARSAALPCNTTCDTVISCANVKIRSSTGSQDFHGQCRMADSRPSNIWPYVTTHVFASRVIDLDMRMTLKYMPSTGVLEFEIENNILRTVELLALYNGTADSHAFIGELMEGRVSNERSITGRVKISQEHAVILLEGVATLKIKTPALTFWAPVLQHRVMYEPGVYGRHHETYSKSGWLTGPLFIGEDSRFSSVNIPRGPCAPQSYRYVASLSDSTTESAPHHHKPRAIMILTFIDQRVHLSAAFHSLDSNISHIVFNGSLLAEGVNVPVRKIIQDCRVSKKMSVFTAQFLRQVTVTTPTLVMTGHLRRGMAADIESPVGFCGVAVFQFLVGASLHFSILAYSGDYPSGAHRNLHSVTLNGPARVGMEGHTVATLTQYVYTYRSGWVYGNSTIHILDSSFLLHLWSQRVYLSLSFNKLSHSRTFSGQLSVPGAWMCDQDINLLCPVVHLSPTKAPPSSTLTNTSAGIAVFLWDRADVVQYSVWLRVGRGESTPNGHIEADGSVLYGLNVFEKSFEEDFVYISQGKLAVRSSSFDHRLSSGDLRLQLTTSSHTDLISPIPATHRPKCYKTKIKFKVEQNPGWTIGSRALHELYAIVNDTVVFTYSDADTVHNLTDQSAYESCDFNGSLLIGQQLDLRRVRDYYIASYRWCEDDTKFIISVRQRETAANETYCATPVFEGWWSAELASHGGTNILGAALSAAVVGAIICATLAVLDHHVRAANSDGFERF